MSLKFDEVQTSLVPQITSILKGSIIYIDFSYSQNVFILMVPGMQCHGIPCCGIYLEFLNLTHIHAFECEHTKLLGWHGST